MTTIQDTKDRIEELELQPLRIKGELVADNWWATPEPPPVSAVRRHWLFLTVFCLPVILTGIYLFLIASDQYSSEAQFIVRASARSDVGNLASLMQGQKMSRATDETYAVTEYLRSRDVVSDLIRDDHLRDILARPEADLFNRFPNIFSRSSDESLYRHFTDFVDLKTDGESGIGLLRVRAFIPEDARDLARALLKHGEQLVNRLNARAFQDAVQFADRQLQQAKERILEVERQLTDFRNNQRVIDPNKEAAAALSSVAALMGSLTETQVALAQLVATTPQSPSIASMREKAQAYQEQITQQRAQIAGSASSMAGTMAAYDSLMLDRELAQRSLEAAALHLTSARQDAGQQQLYLQTIVAPDLPDMARYPRRFLILLLVSAFCMCVFVIIRSLLRVLWEHQA